MTERFSAWYRRHRDFLLLLALFVTLRLFIVIFMRAGGQWADYSDYWWYYQAAALTDHGYLIWRDFWSDYPPLFYMLVVGLYRLAALLPTWTQPALWFYVLFGSFMALAEMGNFVMLYWLARRLYAGPTQAALRPLWLYAGLFGPVFVLAGYLDQLALFWLLLALLLAIERRYALSAISTGVGFMIKVFPLLVAPTAFKLASWRGKIAYVVGLALTLLVTNLPFYLWSPTIFVASWRAMIGQPSWETIWALLDGYRSFGIVPGNRFNPATAAAAGRPETLPWFAVLSVFALIYLALWSRPWQRRGHLNESERLRRIIAFVGLTIVLFYTFSKGWSPQFIAWIIPFLILLLPNGWGVAYSLILSALAVIERILVFLLLSDSTWLLEWVIYIRTAFLLVLVVEFAVQAGVFPAGGWQRFRRAGAVPVALLLVTLALAGTVRGLDDYRAMMAATTPYRPVLDRLAPVVGTSDALVTTSRESFDQISSYWPGPVRVWPRAELEERAQAWTSRWEQLLNGARVVWLLQDYRGGLNAPWNEELASRLAARGYLAHDEWLSDQERLLGFALGRATGAVQRPADACFAAAICLRAWQRDDGWLPPRAPLRASLTWEAVRPPATDLTMFVQLLGPDGRLAVGRDVPLSVDGQPASAWSAGSATTSRVALLLPTTLSPGTYTLIAGLYDPISGVRLTRPDGADFFRLGQVEIGGPAPR